MPNKHAEFFLSPQKGLLHIEYCANTSNSCVGLQYTPKAVGHLPSKNVTIGIVFILGDTPFYRMVYLLEHSWLYGPESVAAFS